MRVSYLMQPARKPFQMQAIFSANTSAFYDPVAEFLGPVQTFAMAVGTLEQSS